MRAYRPSYGIRVSGGRVPGEYREHQEDFLTIPGKFSHGMRQQIHYEFPYLARIYEDEVCLLNRRYQTIWKLRDGVVTRMRPEKSYRAQDQEDEVWFYGSQFGYGRLVYRIPATVFALWGLPPLFQPLTPSEVTAKYRDDWPENLPVWERFLALCPK